MRTHLIGSLQISPLLATQDPVEGVAAIPGLLAGAAVASGVVHLEPRAGHDCCENEGKSELGGWWENHLDMKVWYEKIYYYMEVLYTIDHSFTKFQ